MDPIDSSDIPEMPLPLVQPSAIRAPNNIMNPPQKAINDLLKSVVIDAALVHAGEKFLRLVLDHVEEM